MDWTALAVISTMIIAKPPEISGKHEDRTFFRYVLFFTFFFRISFLPFFLRVSSFFLKCYLANQSRIRTINEVGLVSEFYDVSTPWRRPSYPFTTPYSPHSISATTTQFFCRKSTKKSRAACRLYHLPLSRLCVCHTHSLTRRTCKAKARFTHPVYGESSTRQRRRSPRYDCVSPSRVIVCQSLISLWGTCTRGGNILSTVHRRVDNNKVSRPTRSSAVVLN